MTSQYRLDRFSVFLETMRYTNINFHSNRKSLLDLLKWSSEGITNYHGTIIDVSDEKLASLISILMLRNTDIDNNVRLNFTHLYNDLKLSQMINQIDDIKTNIPTLESINQHVKDIKLAKTQAISRMNKKHAREVLDTALKDQTLREEIIEDLIERKYVSPFVKTEVPRETQSEQVSPEHQVNPTVKTPSESDHDE